MGSKITISLTVENLANRVLYVYIINSYPTINNVNQEILQFESADDEEGSEYVGGAVEVEGNTTAYFKMTVEVLDANTSLQDAIWGYQIQLTDTSIIETTEDYSNLVFETDEDTRTATVYGARDDEGNWLVSGDVVVPEIIEITDSGEAMAVSAQSDPSNVYTVTSIGYNAFGDSDNDWSSEITNIQLPNTIKTIDEGAFYMCYNLESIEIPDSVISIGNVAFSDCPFVSVVIPDSVESIGDYIFAYCADLESVTIAKGVSYIGEKIFYQSEKLSSIEVVEGNSVYEDGDGNAIIERESNILIFGCKNTDIPNSVTSIGDYAFSWCTGLTSVVIPDSVTSIGNSAFDFCSGLTEIVIPDSVTSIGNQAFYGCSGLETVYYTGTEAQWTALTANIREYNNDLLNANIICSDTVTE